MAAKMQNHMSSLSSHLLALGGLQRVGYASMEMGHGNATTPPPSGLGTDLETGGGGGSRYSRGHGKSSARENTRTPAPGLACPLRLC